MKGGLHISTMARVTRVNEICETMTASWLPSPNYSTTGGSNTSVIDPKRHLTRRSDAVAIGGIVLQKSKVAGLRIFAKNRNGKQSPIRLTSIALPRLPMSLTCRDEAPHIFIRNPRQWPLEFLSTGVKRVLQHNRGRSGHGVGPANRSFMTPSRHGRGRNFASQRGPDLRATVLVPCRSRTCRFGNAAGPLAASYQSFCSGNGDMMVVNE